MSKAGRLMAQTVKARKERAQTTTWLTPRWILDALGDFNLDPCAAPEPRPWSTARTMVSLPDDGLKINWIGQVFVNPPFGLSAIDFIKKLKNHGEGVLLLPLRGDTHYFHDLVWNHARSMLVFRRRINFCLPDGTASKGNLGGAAALFAYGLTAETKIKRLSEFGYFTTLTRKIMS